MVSACAVALLGGLARPALAEEPDPNKPVEVMTTEEILVGYLLARYLVDGRPEDTPAALAAIGKGTGPDDWCASVLQSTVPGLERRLRRWIRETGEP